MPDLAQKPAHVPDALVRDFDFFRIPGADKDPHLAWKTLHDGPDIFWTPHYGGHWVSTRADDIEYIQLTHEIFSHREFSLPKGVKPFPFVPLEYDPPEHADYRALLNPAFSPKALADRTAEARQLAIELIESFRPRGHCEFVQEFAKVLPITVFLHMVDLPLDDKAKYLKWAEVMVRSPSFEERQKAFGATVAFLSEKVDERIARPGQDLISYVVNAKVHGQPMSRDQILGMCSVLFFGGLDTVAAELSFIIWFLARHPEHRRQLLKSAEIPRNAIEEFLRRFGLSNTMRTLTQDCTLKGAPMKKDEMIQVPIALHGLDERRWPDPLAVDFNRSPNFHATFGNGPHRCPGSMLARNEIRILLEEWLPRIPDFEVTPGAEVITQSGNVNGVISLPLSWKV